MSSVYNKSIKDHLYKWYMYLLSSVDWHLDWYPYQHSIPWSTLNQNFIDTSVDNRLTLNQRLINMSGKSQLSFKRCTVGLHSADYQLIIDQVLIEMLMDCQLSISLDANWVSIEMSIRDWLRISIDTQIQMHLLQVTSKLNPQIYPSISSFNVYPR